MEQFGKYGTKLVEISENVVPYHLLEQIYDLKMKHKAKINNKRGKKLVKPVPTDNPKRTAKNTETVVLNENQLPTSTTVQGLIIQNYKGKGRGLQATQKIAANLPIIEYVGILRTVNEFRKMYMTNPSQLSYGMELEGGLIIDASTFGNKSRFINHSCASNARATLVRTKDGESKVLITAKSNIFPGEEITYDYRIQSFTGSGETFRCLCGAPNCKDKGKDRTEFAKKHECPFCKKKYSLDRHMDTVHVAAKKNYTCEQCNKGFAVLQYLKNHQKTHLLNRPKTHGCTTCGKKFLSKSHLRGHEEIHAEKKASHICLMKTRGGGQRSRVAKVADCMSAFSSKTGLRKHYKRHIRIYKKKGSEWITTRNPQQKGSAPSG